MFGLVYRVWGYLLYGSRPSDFSDIIRILGSWWHFKLDSIKQLDTCLQEHWFQHVRVQHSNPPAARPNVDFFQRPAVWLGYMLVHLWTRCISSVDWGPYLSYSHKAVLYDQTTVCREYWYYRFMTTECDSAWNESNSVVGLSCALLLGQNCA